MGRDLWWAGHSPADEHRSMCRPPSAPSPLHHCPPGRRREEGWAVSPRFSRPRRETDGMSLQRESLLRSSSSCLGNVCSEPGAELGAVTPTHQLSPQLPRKCPSVGQQRRQWARKVPIQKLLAEPQWKGDVATAPKGLQGTSAAGERKLTQAGSGEPPAQTREEGMPAAEALSPTPGFAGLLWDGAASLDSRPSWAAA